jgi:hypothetical protein
MAKLPRFRSSGSLPIGKNAQMSGLSIKELLLANERATDADNIESSTLLIQLKHLSGG